jgi:hypothetical protein
MTFDELLVEDRIERVNELNAALMRYQDEAEAEGRGGLRRSIAGGLVRLGAWLDRGAVERAAVMRRAL